MTTTSVISPIIDQQGVLLLDGGLATELERDGFKLNHKLWSAQIMRTNPYAIKKVHRAYLNAGADCIITASYQVSFAGCREVGMKDWEIKALLESTVQVADEARTEFLRTIGAADRPRPLVAASIGPYGAYLANGAEYTGDYGISSSALKDFHEPRWEVLSQSKADLLICETIPNYQEAAVLLELIESSDQEVLVSFSCKDNKHIHDGTPLAECAALFANTRQVAAIGVNCTAPQYISDLIEEVKKSDPIHRVIVYPNSGAKYDPKKRAWRPLRERDSFIPHTIDWMHQGAKLIGGCCRTTPRDIESIRAVLLGEVNS